MTTVTAQSLKVALVHVVGMASVGVCWGIASWLTTMNAPDFIVASIITAPGLFWGKIGFKPVGAVLDKILANVVAREPERIERAVMSLRPPAPPAEPRLVVSAAAAPPADRDV